MLVSEGLSSASLQEVLEIEGIVIKDMVMSSKIMTREVGIKDENKFIQTINKDQ